LGKLRGVHVQRVLLVVAVMVLDSSKDSSRDSSKESSKDSSNKRQ
jgi:hypothetical protein